MFLYLSQVYWLNSSKSW